MPGISCSGATDERTNDETGAGRRQSLAMPDSVRRKALANRWPAEYATEVPNISRSEAVALSGVSPRLRFSDVLSAELLV